MGVALTCLMAADALLVQVDLDQDMVVLSDILTSPVFEVHTVWVGDLLGSMEVILDTEEMDNLSLAVMMDILTTLA